MPNVLDRLADHQAHSGQRRLIDISARVRLAVGYAHDPDARGSNCLHPPLGVCLLCRPVCGIERNQNRRCRQVQIYAHGRVRRLGERVHEGVVSFRLRMLHRRRRIFASLVHSDGLHIHASHRTCPPRLQLPQELHINDQDRAFHAQLHARLEITLERVDDILEEEQGGRILAIFPKDLPCRAAAAGFSRHVVHSR